MPVRENFDNVLAWTNDLDDNTRRQAANSAALPFLAGPVALMPDAHFGYGATVGSVIPTKGAVIPSAVGVDIGCFDAETEFLSPFGWKSIATWDGEMVMQYDSDTGEGQFVEPLEFINREQRSFYHLKTKYGIDQMLTPDHRMLVWRPRGRSAEEILEVVTADQFVEEHDRLKLGNPSLFETTFKPVGLSGLSISDEELRIQVMFAADGHLERGRIGVLRFKKQRKIDRAHRLLREAGWVYSSNVTSHGVTVFRIGVPPMPANKSLGGMWGASGAQLRVVADECLHWDGNLKNRVFYTRDRASADFVHYAFAASGYRSVLRKDERDGSIDYRVFAHRKTRVSMSGAPKSAIVEVPSRDGRAYCFRVPSSFLVMRRNGNIFITGNCGMIAVETNLDSNALGDDLSDLHDALRVVIPAGMGQGHDVNTDIHDAGLRSHMPQLPLGNAMTQRQKDKAVKQFGSLGGGNHFVEVCLDERDVVWVVLHSGSRGIGHELANVHIDGAKALMKRYFIELPDPDLAYLVEGTDEFKAYISAMLWAQDYALGNREAMMDAALATLREFLVGSSNVDIDLPLEANRINCHHNYTERENHRNENVWITRKGAIRARVGDLGVIPGSMGAASYIVSGRGNSSSYCSASHGAGRKLSRSKARKTLDVAGLRSAMGDRAWDESMADELIDEDPRAYKDIDVVMDNQSDLVRVEHTLHQVLNLKGTK